MPAGRAPHTVRLLVAALLVASAPAHAAYKDSYARGLKAAGDGNWSEVEARMREALAEEPTPNARTVLYGRVAEPYVPQYFLGIAAHKRGDCAGALRNLQHGPTRAAVADPKARPRLSRFESAASQALRACEQQAGPDPAEIARLEAEKRAAEQKAAEQKAAELKLAEQRELERKQAEQRALAQKEAERKAAEQRAAQQQEVKPPQPPVQPTATPAPVALATALDNFLRGRYVEAASVNPAALADAKARFHALLVRAAARHTQAQVVGDPGNVLMGQAAADVRAAKGLQPNARPDENLYSPRFRKFYTDTR